MKARFDASGSGPNFGWLLKSPALLCTIPAYSNDNSHLGFHKLHSALYCSRRDLVQRNCHPWIQAPWCLVMFPHIHNQNVRCIQFRMFSQRSQRTNATLSEKTLRETQHNTHLVTSRPLPQELLNIQHIYFLNTPVPKSCSKVGHETPYLHHAVGYRVAWPWA